MPGTAITQNMTADLTVNTDFAQVEADEQQINLTRFSLFFPEKREFFLENQGTFSFGGVTAGSVDATSDAPMLFYSRRIGLSGSRVVPLDVGGRVTGRIGAFTIGAVNIQTGDLEDPDGDGPVRAEPPTNFTVLRLKRDILRKSSVGLIATNRSVAQIGTGSNLAYGVDGTFGFFDNLTFNTSWSMTGAARSPGSSLATTATTPATAPSSTTPATATASRSSASTSATTSTRRSASSAATTWSATTRSSASARARSGRSVVRKYHYQALVGVHREHRRARSSRARSQAAASRSSSRTAIASASATADQYEFLPVPFPIGGRRHASGRRLRLRHLPLSLQHGPAAAGRRPICRLEVGTFYNGRKTTLQRRARAACRSAASWRSSRPTRSTASTLVQGRFTTHLAGSRVTYTMTPLMFVSALMQYNSGSNAVSTNARLRWEYRPGSELFVVYNEERNTLTRQFSRAEQPVVHRQGQSAVSFLAGRR